MKSWAHDEANLRTGASGRAGRVTVRELLAEVYPGVTLTRDVGEFGTLLAIDRARAALGFTPQHSWRDHLDPRSS